MICAARKTKASCLWGLLAIDSNRSAWLSPRCQMDLSAGKGRGFTQITKQINDIEKSQADGEIKVNKDCHSKNPRPIQNKSIIASSSNSRNSWQTLWAFSLSSASNEPFDDFLFQTKTNAEKQNNTATSPSYEKNATISLFFFFFFFVLNSRHYFKDMYMYVFIVVLHVLGWNSKPCGIE